MGSTLKLYINIGSLPNDGENLELILLFFGRMR
jgi:hypothetical protein